MKKLLIITQKVNINDPILGFFHEWILRLSKNFDKTSVICLERGQYNLPNVDIISLGKDQGKIKLVWLINFYRIIISKRNDYDYVLVHMNPIYSVIGGLVWRLMNKKVFLWYAHGKVSFTLRLASLLSNKVITSTKDGFRINSRKRRIVGQGIDTDLFYLPQQSERADGIFRIISVGRISRSKHYEVIIEAIYKLIELYPTRTILFELVGKPLTREEEEYQKELELKIKNHGLDEVFKFVGPIVNRELASKLHGADLFINSSRTGSLDKAILEAMACGLPVLTSNEGAFDEIGYDFLLFKKGDVNDLVSKMSNILSMNISERFRIGQNLRDRVVENHSLNRLIEKILNVIRE